MKKKDLDSKHEGVTVACMTPTKLDENIVVTVKITSAQRNMLKAIAEAQGLRLGAWARQILLREAARRAR